MGYIERYGRMWPDDMDALQIELACIQLGGKWKGNRGQDCGLGFPHHYEQARRLLWPDLDDHRWHRLCRDNILSHKVTVLMGPGSSGKTHEASWIYLVDYFAWPEETLVMVSSTDMRGLQLRVFGEMKTLWEKAKDRYPELPGNIVDSKCAICTDALEEDKVRDMRKGVIGIPTIQNGKQVGLGKWCGCKQKRIRLIADECQFMGISFLSAFANLDKNVDFRAVCLGNPNDPLDPLGKAAEPLDGWASHLEPDKTSVWKTRFMNGVCVNLIGTDSPNFDFPESEPTRYRYLISREKIANTLSFFPKDSVEYYSQCVGAMKVGVLARRVITRDLCSQFGAMGDVIWKGDPRVVIGAMDSAYGGDRCVGGKIEFGLDSSGTQVIRVHQPQIVPIVVKRNELTPSPEDQIAEWVKEFCDHNGIEPDNFFHDSTGRGGLGTAISRVYSDRCNPVEFGGTPTPRPVSLDLWIYDMKEQRRRLKLCSEHYDRLVTELWWSIRLAITARQLRGLPEDVMEELCMREWDKVKEDKIRIETKKDMKERVGRSPDLGDWLAIAIEGARRRGFQIAKLANEEESAKSTAWLLDLERRQKNLTRHHSLTYS